jgi:hypothetical protein
LFEFYNHYSDPVESKIIEFKRFSRLESGKTYQSNQMKFPLQIVPSQFYELYPLSHLTKLPEYGDWIAIYTIYFTFVYVAGGMMSEWIPSYQKLSRGKKANWCAHIVSMAFSLFVPFLAIDVLQETNYDKIFGTSENSFHAYAFTCGYFVWDTLFSIWEVKETGVVFILHGAAALILALFSYLPFGHYYGAFYILLECSMFF